MPGSGGFYLHDVIATIYFVFNPEVADLCIAVQNRM